MRERGCNVRTELRQRPEAEAVFVFSGPQSRWRAGVNITTGVLLADQPGPGRPR